jgi:RNA polymerase sigma-70 factor (ECF subfamily)
LTALHDGDLKLAQRMLSGDEAAFNEFFDRHFQRLYRYSLARLDQDPADAQDVAQATICTGISKLHTFRGEASLLTWLCTICRHEIGELRRRMARRPARLDDDTPAIRAALEAIASNDPDHPEAVLQRTEVARSVQRTLDALPERYREVLALKYLEGLPVKEIAERLALAPKAAESLLTRAREAFRDRFPESADEARSWSAGGSGGTQA